MSEVYPRVGGGTAPKVKLQEPQLGLSPRGRGNPPPGAARTASTGSIPAWAGEPAGLPCRPCPRSVYPRVGGGTANRRTWPMMMTGLSPRGRGNHLDGLATGRGRGSIPAWAGEPLSLVSIRVMSKVYPRVGGGTYQAFGLIPPSSGLSPRGRGNPLFQHIDYRQARL